jgi:carbon monoxide dehydrogenase subunit G
VQVEGKYTFNASVEQVWELMLSAEALTKCVPGCEKLDAIGEDQYEAVMKVGVGAIRGTYKGKISVQEKQPPTRYKLVVEGSGNAGFVRGHANIELASQGDGTTLVSVVGESQVGGPVAGVGQRMLGGVAKMQMNSFFECMQKQLAAKVEQG